MSCFAFKTFEGLRLPDYHVSYVFLRQYIKRRPHGRSLVLNTCNQNDGKFPQQTFRTFVTSCGSQEVSAKTVPSLVAEETLSRIQELGISADEIKLDKELSKFPVSLLELRLQFCLEGGLQPSILCLTKFDEVAKSSLPVLRSAGLLPENVDVVDRMLSSVNFDGPPPAAFRKHSSYEFIHFHILNHCMEYFFGNSFPSWKRYLHASLHFTFDNIKLLKGANLGWQWLRDHPSMICFSNPRNLVKLCELEKKFEIPIGISQLLRRDADVAFINFEDLIATFFVLKRHEVCRHDLSRVKRADHFLVSPDYLDLQFQKLRESKASIEANNLELLYKLKYITRQSKRTSGHLTSLIARQNFPVSPLSKMLFPEGSWQHEMKLWLVNCDNALEYKPCRHKPFLTSPVNEEISSMEEETVEKFSGKKANRLPDYIANELDVPVAVVKAELSLIPLGLTVDVNQASSTFKFLLDHGYSKGEIRESVQLLLYPRNIVKKTLEQSVFSDPIYKSKDYKGRHLHLCLYHILMTYNYTLSHV